MSADDDYAAFARDAMRELDEELDRAPKANRSSKPDAPLHWRMITAVDNERHAPELLPYPDALINEAMLAIAHQSDKIAAMEQARKADDDAPVSLLPFFPEDLFRVEIQRLQYLVSDLLRLRIKKIQRFSALIASDPSAFTTVLTPNEAAVAQRLHTLIHQAVLDGGLRLVAPELQSLLPSQNAEGPECIPRPDMSTFVFAIALEDMTLKIADVEPLNLKTGDLWICRYGDLRDQLLQSKLRLV